ncbi:Putative short chain dehydrogenase/reductase [Mycobacteroides abscessus subsp. abscessus]|uniref:Short chain dehydrogenase/reductase n=9 Tax=Mycobacteroides abscessus TaxID=36809 RepID=B1MMJ6_MYCA9|nr:glucose 1-dehydrogenase [Mycobacteroides abscessus]ETZ87059.1 short chain dehydrogenase family protein [Mycobacteroides abscessus MAB_030201_1075]ETZ91545.1 short chain dehydrogenase family protein [Mycobacteroides abscessus MAB_030201_1061]EUA63705.1 short chain dehydrogenase family protein [Mycobacteroides abscessus 1948]AKP60615.1 short-chain dehydrogenase [Mycobacteroides abscessus UC22]ALM19011.1 short-chain dehydrogenase [Mycobacteroides abscessus]
MLQDKVVVVTGGSRGLGRAMVRAFAAHGADVVIASRKIDSCQELAAQVEAEHGRRALPVACNVSSWEQCDHLVDTVYREFGRVDVLVNNAGLSPLYPSLDQVSEALFDKVIGVNLKGPFRLSASIATKMAAGAGGSIINISSIEAVRPDATALPYAAAKAGLNALTLGLSHTFGPTVRTNTIQCGLFNTDIAAAWPEGFAEALIPSIPLRRVGEPEDIVGAALYLASEASAYCTGTTIRLDGGIL